MLTDNKAFRDRRSRKLQKRKRKGKHCGKTNIQNSTYYHDGYGNQVTKSYDYSIDFPKTFSFISDMSGTVDFCMSTINKLGRYMVKSTIHMNLYDIEYVSADAIMYLIAIIRNHRSSRKRLYSFRGNYPQNSIAKNIICESGFLKFVQSNLKELPQNTKKQTIVSGRNNDPATAMKYCDFICQKLSMPKSYTTFLYEVIIEMMSNVVYHAYADDDEMIPEWYIYAEYENEEINFIFLDTGLGIAKTVQKHSLYEKVVNKIGLASESKLIKSAFDGDFRTNTGKDYHGKGMPYIKKFAFENKVKSFHVLSGKGHCWINSKDSQINCEDIGQRLSGTMYIFTLVKSSKENNK